MNSSKEDEGMAMERGKLKAFDFVIMVLKEYERHLNIQFGRLEAFMNSLFFLFLRLECVCEVTPKRTNRVQTHRAPIVLPCKHFSVR
jgi:hypothetical protein